MRETYHTLLQDSTDYFGPVQRIWELVQALNGPKLMGRLDATIELLRLAQEHLAAKGERGRDVDAYARAFIESGGPAVDNHDRNKWFEKMVLALLDNSPDAGRLGRESLLALETAARTRNLNAWRDVAVGRLEEMARGDGPHQTEAAAAMRQIENWPKPARLKPKAPPAPLPGPEREVREAMAKNWMARERLGEGSPAQSNKAVGTPASRDRRVQNRRPSF